VTGRALDPETRLLSGRKINELVLPDDLDPLLIARIDKVKDPRHYSALGTHAEVLAADELLKARRAAGLPVSDEIIDSFVHYQRWLDEPLNPAAMCPNCTDTLSGSVSIPGKR
jgi:hypothetical protein